MNDHEYIDEFKLRAAKAVLDGAELKTIRKVSLANLDRWNAKGVWVSAHDEWRALMLFGTDKEIIEAMTGGDQRANRLRQSPPYVGLISEKTRQKLLSEVRLLKSDESWGHAGVP